VAACVILQMAPGIQRQEAIIYLIYYIVVKETDFKGKSNKWCPQCLWLTMDSRIATK